MAYITESFKLNNARLSFPELFKPVVSKFNPNAEPKYEATFLLQIGNDAEQIDKLRAVVAGLVAKKWPNGAKNVKFCIGRGDDKEYDGYAGTVTVKASSKKRPTVVNRDRSPITEADGIIYAGCYVNAVIDLYAMDDNGIKGVFAWLTAVQFSQDGQAFGKSFDVETGFEVVGEAASPNGNGHSELEPANDPNSAQYVGSADLPF